MSTLADDGDSRPSVWVGTLLTKRGSRPSTGIGFEDASGRDGEIYDREIVSVVEAGAEEAGVQRARLVQKGGAGKKGKA